MLSSTNTWRNQLPEAWKLVAPFNVNMRLSKFLLPANSQHSKLKLFAEIPDIDVNFSDNVLSAIRAIAAAQLASPKPLDAPTTSTTPVREGELDILASQEHSVGDNFLIDSSLVVKNLLIRLHVATQGNPKHLVDMAVSGLSSKRM